MIWGVTGMIIFMPLVGIAKALLEYHEKTKPLAALLTTVPKDALIKRQEPDEMAENKLNTSENT